MVRPASKSIEVYRDPENGRYQTVTSYCQDATLAPQWAPQYAAPDFCKLKPAKRSGVVLKLF